MINERTDIPGGVKSHLEKILKKTRTSNERFDLAYICRTHFASTKMSGKANVHVEEHHVRDKHVEKGPHGTHTEESVHSELVKVADAKISVRVRTI